ncbi:hypothetical protein [Paenibacillus sacheonensis]|uniref:Uncharacterized protein n=1 Tax=Paenibacillus sacheonensis TaxID=742054 RepID=A0A7X4YJC5_9BACL|nr:hypothetical protein [Paenibacillus sacheonensis]MBM7564215.1 hypothetical protein [Paenibacillus sacheonensis]NBC67462.1 hypothetical protein [Paenibacillus sacheonensis]
MKIERYVSRKTMLALVIGALCVWVLSACGTANTRIPVPANGMATHNPTAEEMLRADPDADFFQWDDVIYTNGSSIDWVQDETVKAEAKVGTIGKKYEAGAAFENGMATKLPAGAEIYGASKHGASILIVKWEGHEVRYLAMLEG